MPSADFNDMEISVPLNEDFLSMSSGSTSDEMFDAGDSTNSMIVMSAKQSEIEQKIYERVKDLAKNGVALTKSSDSDYYFSGALFDDEAKEQMRKTISSAIDESEILSNIKELLNEIKENTYYGVDNTVSDNGSTRNKGKNRTRIGGMVSVGSGSEGDSYKSYIEEKEKEASRGESPFSRFLSEEEFSENEKRRAEIERLKNLKNNSREGMSDSAKRDIDKKIYELEADIAKEPISEKYSSGDTIYDYSKFKNLEDYREQISDISQQYKDVKQVFKREGAAEAFKSATDKVSTGVASEGISGALSGLASKAGYAGLAIAAAEAFGASLNKIQDYKNIGIEGGYTGAEAAIQGAMEKGSANVRGFFSTLDSRQIMAADKAAANLGYNENTAQGLAVSGVMQGLLKDYGMEVNESSTFYKTLVKSGTMSSKEMVGSIDKVADIAKDGFISTKDAIKEWKSGISELTASGISADVSDEYMSGVTSGSAASDSLSLVNVSSSNMLRYYSNLTFGDERENMTDEEWGEYSFYRAIVECAKTTFGCSESYLKSTVRNSGAKGISTMFGLSDVSGEYQNSKLITFKQTLQTYGLSFGTDISVEGASQLICDAVKEIYSISSPSGTSFTDSPSVSGSAGGIWENIGNAYLAYSTAFSLGSNTTTTTTSATSSSSKNSTQTVVIEMKEKDKIYSVWQSDNNTKD